MNLRAKLGHQGQPSAKDVLSALVKRLMLSAGPTPNPSQIERAIPFARE